MMLADPIVGLAAAAGLSWAGVAWAFRFTRRRALLDMPSARSSHTVPTPRGGGLGITFAVVACLLGEALHRGEATFALRALPLVVACGIGFADDRKAIAPGPKMALLLVAGVLALPVATVRQVELPYLGTIGLGLLAVPLSLLWLTGFANAFNFMDGVNGISALTVLVSGLAFSIAGRLAGDQTTAYLGAVAAGAGAGFLPWNFPRARIFMGDSGSLPLGMFFAIVAVEASRSASPGIPAAIEFPASVLLLGPYVFDVTFTLVRRAREGKPLAQAHREHLYQRLSRAVGGHPPAALAFAALSAATSALAIFYGHREDLGRLLSLLLPLLALMNFARWVVALEARASSLTAASTDQAGATTSDPGPCSSARPGSPASVPDVSDGPFA